jgi:hypothetical protein
MSGSSWKMIGKNLYQTVQRLKSRLSPAHWPHEFRMVYAHALDGNPAGLSVIGADGGPVWLVPPAGCKTGEPVEETDDPVDDTDEPYPEAA